MSKARWILIPPVLVGLLASCGGGGDNVAKGFSSAQGSFEAYTDLTGLNLSEITPIPFESGSGQVSLETTENSSHLVIVTSANTSPSSYTVQLGAGSLPSLSALNAALEGDEEVDPEPDQFHQVLRELESGLGESGEVRPVRRSSLAALTQAPEVGDLETFKVLSTMTSLTRYETVEAELRIATPNIHFFVETESADQISDADLEALADSFEAIILPRDRSLFGEESDINGDGRITVLMSCVTNRMATSGGIVTGFFFPGDLYADSSSNPASNEQEIFYTLVPDPDGRCGVPISAEFATQNILPGVLAHEFQHMISFNNHVLKGKGAAEEPWLNEAMSHLAEDLCGYGQENPSRVKLFLDQPATTSLIPSTSPQLAERGAAYLFLRYLYEQHPEGGRFVNDLAAGSQRGIQNVLSAFGGDDPSLDEFAEMIGRWAIALALSDTGIVPDPAYNYRARSTDPETGNPTGICLRCDAADGRGTVLNGPAISTVASFPLTANLNSSASQFFWINEVPSNLTIASAGSPTLTGAILRLER